MRVAHRIDEAGYFVEDLVLQPDEAGSYPDEERIVYAPPPANAGLHIPRWMGSEWVEGKPASEILALARARRAAEVADAATRKFATDADGEPLEPMQRVMQLQYAQFALSTTGRLPPVAANAPALKEMFETMESIQSQIEAYDHDPERPVSEQIAEVRRIGAEFVGETQNE